MFFSEICGRRIKNTNGFTLIELMIAMAIAVGGLLITSSVFSSLTRSISTQVKSAESHIEGIVGLEMLRYDMEHAGYGLPWVYPAGTSFTFTELGAGDIPVIGITSSAFNETTPPRAVIAAPSTNTDRMLDCSPAGSPALSVCDKTNPGSDYLVIKSVLTPLGPASKRWSYIFYNYTSTTGNASYIKQWTAGGKTAENNLLPNDQVITVNSLIDTTGNPTKQLVMSGTDFSYAVPGATPPVIPPDDNYKPTNVNQTFIVYALDNFGNSTDKPIMPYNRADYYVKRPGTSRMQMPGSCNKGTGMLYKATVYNKVGRAASYLENPLLACVGDMQVGFLLDMDGDGNPLTYSNADGSAVDSLTEGATVTTVQSVLQSAALLRQGLKEIRVYLLAHEGGKDTSYTYPADTITVSDPQHTLMGRTWNAAAMATAFGTDWRNYRWKVYTLIIRPKNLA